MSYKIHLSLAGSLLMAGLLASCQFDTKQVADGNAAPVSTNRMLNPIVPPGVYIADPEVRQMPDGRIYVYGSRDEPGNAWCSRSYNVLSSSDLVNWNVEQFSFATDGPLLIVSIMTGNIISTIVWQEVVTMKVSLYLLLLTVRLKMEK